MKMKVIGFINFFLSFLTRYDDKRVHNMLTLMLDPIFKRLRLIFFLIGGELGVAIATKYDKKSLFLMLLKSYHHLHPLLQLKVPLLSHLMKTTIWIFLRW
jgi:hypothetical protein